MPEIDGYELLRIMALLRSAKIVSQRKTEITKYTAAPASAGFALIMTLFMHYMYVPLRKSVHKAAAGIPTPYIIMLAAVLLIDFFSSFINMYQNHGSNSLWNFIRMFPVFLHKIFPISSAVSSKAVR